MLTRADPRRADSGHPESVTIEIEVTPHLEGRVHRERFEARVGERLLCVSRQPLLDAARLLIREGHDPATRLVMKHAGSTTTAMTTTVGIAARFTVEDGVRDRPRFRRWHPPRFPRGRPLAATNERQRLEPEPEVSAPPRRVVGGRR
jgi:hypothetical protein